jgi:ferric-dicitrate binding protein FerR (iron transport regulator)
MTESDRFWLLVSRKLANEASRTHLAELEQMIAAHPDYKAKYEALCNYWQHTDRKKDVDVNAALQKTLHTLHAEEERLKKNPSRKIKLSSIWLGIAAGFMLLILIIISLRPSLFQPLHQQTDIVNKHNEKGMRSEILLSDGSVVWLNADSEIRYPEVFNAHSREIHLSGEAYFDIAPNPVRPFIIHLENNQIRVLGTSFNVKAYKEDDVVETAVVSGEVAFIRTGALATKDQKDTLLLTSNYKALYSKHTGTLTKTSTDTRLDTAWKDGRLIFRSARFEEVGKILERTYGKEVIFSDKSIRACRLTATFQNNSLEEIMILISKTNEYNYEITEEQLKISGAGCL